MDRVQALRYFKAANAERIRRLIELAPLPQSFFFELLPLIFQTHSKVLPGYINTDMPVGIIDYRPDKKVLEKAKQFDISFSYRQKALRQYPIRGVYLINPHGLLHYPDQPHYSIWVTHQDKLSAEQQQALTQKLQHIQQWAHSLDIELETRLFKESDITQHSISAYELDAFYSGGLIMAGNVPYWWQVPPQDETHYEQAVEKLASQRMLAQASFVDFGQVGQFDAQQIFSTAYHCALHSMQKGLPAILDSLYWHFYLTESDACPKLSTLFKQHAYAQDDTLLFDSNLLKLTAIEAIAETDKAELARQSFYLRCHEKLSRPIKLIPHPWRREFIQEKVTQWSWDEQQLSLLDTVTHDYKHAQHLFELLGKLINECIGSMARFASQHQLNVGEQLQQLRNLYQLRYRPADDAIRILPLDLRPQTLNERLYLYRFKDTHQWYLSQLPLQDSSQNSLFQHPNLLHTLSWAIANQLLKRSDWLSVNDQLQAVTTSTVVGLAKQLLKSSLPEDDLDIHHSTGAEGKARQLLLFINLEKHPSNNLLQQGLHLSSRQSDPLCYSSFEQCLIMSLDGLVQSESGQWHSFSHQGETAVLELLTTLLRWQPSVQLIEQTHCNCSTPSFGVAISSRVKSLLSQCWQHYDLHSNLGKFLLTLKNYRYQVIWHNGLAEYQQHPETSNLWWALSRNTAEFTPTWLDTYLDPDSLLNKLLMYQAPHNLTVFIYTEQNTVVCYILDELGNLIRQQYQHLNESTLLGHLRRFLSDLKSTNHIAQIRFYRLTRNRQQWQLSALATPSANKSYLPVHVVMSSLSATADCTIMCGQKWFEGKREDPELFAQVHQLVLSLRKQAQHYPVYLDTLRIEDDQYHPVMVYLQQKQRLEQSLNSN